MMDKLIQDFPQQLREALEIGKNASITAHSEPITHILVCGMGGSAIGGNFLSEFVADHCPVPISVNKGYTVPGHVGKSTLVICSSYSGNTEETLQAFHQVKDKGAKVVCIASGGKLEEQATTNKYDFIKLPGGKPSPRACMGHSVVQQLFVLHKLGLIDNSLIDQISSSASLLEKESEDIKRRAEHIASFLIGKIPVIYINEGMEAVAIRWRQQINENAKMLAWHHVIPEMNHNELVGWRKQQNEIAVLLLRNRHDLPRNQVRTDICKEILNEFSSTLIEIYSKGETHLERAIYLVHLGDWISWYLAVLQPGVDAVEIKVIDYLKGELAKA
ncbi:MAG: bifunctional phosphoglucose/phosphomannose isomerase [Bacteroidota bacterium]